jgi:hypothetical protein
MRAGPGVAPKEVVVIDRIAGVVLALAAAAGVVWASTVPLRMNASDGALLRLAWGARPERIETCRDLTLEELSKLPQHMRQPRICEGVTAEYRLIVTEENGAVRVDRTIRGGGLRQDRRLYVFEELPIPVGRTTLTVRFERTTRSGDEHESNRPEHDHDRDGHERHERAHNRLGVVPPALSIDVDVTARPRQVILVTYDAQRRELVTVTGPDSD